METKIREDVRNKLSGITTVLSLMEMLQDREITEEQRVELQKILVDSRKVARTALDYLFELLREYDRFVMDLTVIQSLLNALDVLDRDDITDDFRFVMYAKRNGSLLKAHMAVNLILRSIEG